MNDTLYLRFSYPRKSGSHAVMNWVSDILGGDVCLFNNKMFRKLRGQPLGAKGLGLSRGDLGFPELYAPKRLAIPEGLQDRHVFLTFEDKVLEPVPKRACLELDKPGFDIVILRDVYNWLASILIEKGRTRLIEHPDPSVKNRRMWYQYATNIDWKNYVRLDHLVRCWTMHAEEALSPGTYLETPGFSILFNPWKVDKNYRQEICAKLGGSYAERTIKYIASAHKMDGAFDTLEVYEGRGDKLPVLHRWEFFMNNPLYWEILDKYPKLEELSAKLFGEVIPEREKYPLGELARRFRDEP